MKKILSLLIGLSMTVQLAGVAHAAAPKAVFSLDCNTQEKQVSVGFQSDPADPANGPEIIALKFVYILTPQGTSTLDDIKGANLVINPGYANFITAENKKTELGNSIELKLAGGFTGGNGLPQASDLAFVKGINQKSYKIVVQLGELYPKNNNTNIYQNSNEQFIADPSSCSQTTPVAGTTDVQIIDTQFSPASVSIKKGETVRWTNKGQMPHTVSSTNVAEIFDSGSIAVNGTYSHTFNSPGLYSYKCAFHPGMTGTVTVTDPGGITTPTPSSDTSITLTSDKSIAKSGDAVEVNALIKNRGGKAIDWSQTTGSQITPQISNEELPNNETKSTLKFTMVASTQDITLKLVVGDKSETIKIAPEGGVKTPSGSTESTGTQTETGGTLQERLQQRREELNANAAPTTTVAGNVHGAAEGLSKSGPEDTVYLILLSVAAVLGWKKLRRSEGQVDV